jgi:hypothetical protein
VVHHSHPGFVVAGRRPAVKVSKTEEKMRANAAVTGRPYYQQFVDYRQACPYCGEPLRHTLDFSPLSCACGSWSFNWLIGDYEYAKNYPSQTEA